MTTPNLHGEPATEVLAARQFEPAGADRSAVSRSVPAPGRPPRQLRASFWLWLLAVAAGLFETSLVVAEATAGQVGSAAEVAVGVGVRLLAFTGLVYLAARLRQGRNWARIALAVLYGGFGTLSLVSGPVTWLADGGSVTDAIASAGFGLGAVRGQPAGAPGRGHRGADLDVPSRRKRLHPSHPAGPREAEPRINRVTEVAAS